ncbi:protein of unknown function DUF399 [Ectocarpus siliculosus]|uniref:Haem-binding uptake Tiki superfamily ChaN domain-containing protein n=1 Tax=Ectocarpus siliculosus TaxID=2880 RepID=D8LB72_ECTSI|nr:protein of unknown function DUF399 [Ectocarpus siliculosus]|eukprot:CBN76581.1 protein of unknown function DUF399 [Ectocarpus siliculosus]
MGEEASSRSDSPHGSNSGDTLTRQGFIGGLVGAALAPALVKPRPPPSYDVMKYERIFDTARKSFVPADPSRLIFPGVGFADRVVCTGEMHTHPLHHRMQFEVIKAVASVTKAKTEPLAIGLEMFYRQQQDALDRYVFNHGDLAALKLDTKWDETWGFDFNQYAKIFHYARENGIRLVGLNAPQSLLHLINKVGIAGLPQRLREVLPEMDLSNMAHRKRFEDAINGFQHGAGIDAAAMNRMYEAQTLWDEYMAESASRYLQRAGGRIVLLAGNGHVQARDGIPDRVERRTGLKPFTIVPVSVEWTEDGLPDIDHPPGTAFADWVYFTQNEIGPPVRGAGSEGNW